MVSRLNKQLFIAAIIAAFLATFLVAQGLTKSIKEGNDNVLLKAESNPQEDETASTQGSLPANCRYGAALVTSPWGFEWFPELGVGWYVNFGVSPSGTAPNYAEFVHTIRFNKESGGTFYPIWPPLTDAGLGANIDANPGHLWLVGNEMEVDHQYGDRMQPQEYAQGYHDVYNYIKQRDPSAQVGVGGMSMATPARLQYMEIAWDTYQNQYGVTMPVDVWNVHLYIISEADHNGTGDGDGKIALGTDPAIAKRAPNGSGATECPKDEVYCRAEHDSLTVFEEQVVGFRTWMKEHGQQNKPLIISEFSQLYRADVKDEFGDKFTPERVNAFMEASFNYLENAKSSEIGYPEDENRLVQQWMWFSLYTPLNSGYVSNLLKPNYADYTPGDNAAFTEVGQKFQSEVLPRSTYVNLKAGTAVSGVANGSTANLQIGFRNNGITYIDQPFNVTFYADAALTQVIGSTTVNPVVNGCHWHNDTHTATVSWSGLTTGVYSYWAKIDSGNQIGESDESDNVVTGLVFVNDAEPTPSPTPTNGSPDTELPIVSWITPVGNEQSVAVGDGQTIQLAANAVDNVAVDHVRFYRWDATAELWIDIAEDFTAPYQATLNSNELNDGWNQVNAKAYDSSGNESVRKHIWIVKNESPPAATATPTAVATEPATPTPTAGDNPQLNVPTAIPAAEYRPVKVPLNFNSKGNAVTAALFSLDLDQECLLFDTADNDTNGLPDAITSYLPSGYTVTVQYDAGDPTAEFDFLLTNNEAAPLPLADGKLFDITVIASCAPLWGEQIEATIDFVTNPPPTFSTSSGTIMLGQTVNGTVQIYPLPKLFMPIVQTND